MCAIFINYTSIKLKKYKKKKECSIKVKSKRRKTKQCIKQKCQNCDTLYLVDELQDIHCIIFSTFVFVCQFVDMILKH